MLTTLARVSNTKAHKRSELARWLPGQARRAFLSAAARRPTDHLTLIHKAAHDRGTAVDCFRPVDRTTIGRTRRAIPRADQLHRRRDERDRRPRLADQAARGGFRLWGPPSLAARTRGAPAFAPAPLGRTRGVL